MNWQKALDDLKAADEGVVALKQYREVFSEVLATYKKIASVAIRDLDKETLDLLGDSCTRIGAILSGKKEVT